SGAYFLLELGQSVRLTDCRQLLQMRRAVCVDAQFAVAGESGIDFGRRLRQFVLQRTGELLAACRDTKSGTIDGKPLLALRPREKLGTIVGKILGADDV